MKNTLKSTLAAMLTLALMLTSVLTGDPMTAQAELIGDHGKDDRTGIESAVDLEGTTITMKLGEIKCVDMFEYSGKYRIDTTSYYSWDASNDNVNVLRDWYVNNESVRLKKCFLEAQKPGTTVITATDPDGNVVSFKVKVTKPKKTAKQKKCKHKYVTTRTENCFRNGVKTCKKCKWQKLVSRTPHDMQVEQDIYKSFTFKNVYQCGADLCGLDYSSMTAYEIDNHELICENWCEETFDPDEYGSDEAALEACNRHKRTHGAGADSNTRYMQVPVSCTKEVRDVTRCANCEYSDYEIHLMEDVNEANAYIHEQDLINAIFKIED